MTYLNRQPAAVFYAVSSIQTSDYLPPIGRQSLRLLCLHRSIRACTASSWLHRAPSKSELNAEHLFGRAPTHATPFWAACSAARR